MKRLVWCAIALLLLPMLLAWQTAGGPRNADQRAGEERGWDARLERLDPAFPGAYFDLAEEVADAAVTREDRELAQRLFALAGALDREGFGRSSALALAGLADDPQRRRALLALAALLDRDPVNGADAMPLEGPLHVASAQPSLEAALEFSEAMSHFRRGQGQRAISALKNPEVDALLERFGAGSPGGAARFREDCRVFKGGVRPSLAPPDFAAMLAIEEAVLASVGRQSEEREWSSMLIETGNRPLVEVDVANIDAAFGVDSKLVYWRNGRWVAQG